MNRAKQSNFSIVVLPSFDTFNLSTKTVTIYSKRVFYYPENNPTVKKSLILPCHPSCFYFSIM